MQYVGKLGSPIVTQTTGEAQSALDSSACNLNATMSTQREVTASKGCCSTIRRPLKRAIMQVVCGMHSPDHLLESAPRHGRGGEVCSSRRRYQSICEKKACA